MTQDQQEHNWVPATDDYRLALAGGKLICQNPKGAVLKSVPKKLKDSELGTQLRELSLWLAEHQKACIAKVDLWMLRSLPVPVDVVTAVWPDPDWRSALENIVITIGNHTGFLRGVRDDTVGIVDVDGETRWSSAQSFAIPHPVLIDDLADLRELATELSLEQGTLQLYREVFTRPDNSKDKPDANQDDNEVTTYAHGKFEQLNHAIGKATSLGYRVRGGYATCSVWENDRQCEARYWIGSDSPDYETYTGSLLWVDDSQATLALTDVGVVGYAEGMRMASTIYAARTIEKEQD